LAVSHITGSEIGDQYNLYLLSVDGRWMDFAQRSSLIEALDEVRAVVRREEWRVCSLILSDEWEQIPRESIANKSLLSSRSRLSVKPFASHQGDLLTKVAPSGTLHQKRAPVFETMPATC
jgi:hypothetical protein